MQRSITAIRNYAELSRLSNIPTVISNVLVGVALASSESLPGFLAIYSITAAMMLLYVAGMALNDVCDAAIDADECPERPIPSGRISRRGATIFAVVCMLVALGFMAQFGLAAVVCTLILIAVIVLYDLLHKRFAGSVLLMGLCRSLVYISAAAAVAWPLNWSLITSPTLAILLYILLVTFIARVEHSGTVGRRAWLSLLLPVPVLLATFFFEPQFVYLPIATGFLLLTWLVVTSLHPFRSPPRIGLAVMGWLAGICLVDAYFLSLLDQPILILIAFGCFGLTLLGHRFIMGT